MLDKHNFNIYKHSSEVAGIKNFCANVDIWIDQVWWWFKSGTAEVLRMPC